MLSTSMIVSILAGFAFTELTGWLPGGLVVPGYLALHVDQPMRLLATYAAAGLAILLVYALDQLTILFGRRRFMACILAGILAGLLVDAVAAWLPPAGSDLRAIGFVVPGLMAHDALRQGAGKTLLASLAVTLCTYSILVLLR